MKNRKCHHYHCNNELKNSQPKFCSLSCSTKEKNRLSTIKKKETYNKNPNLCKTCNSILVYEIRTNKFCSHSCSATYNNTGRIRVEKSKIKVCQECNSTFEFNHRSSNKFCSTECSRLNTKRKFKEKFDLGLLTERSAIKKYVIERDSYKCSECNISDWNNKPISLHLDHMDGNPSNNMPENFRLLCPNCHSQTESYGSKNKGFGRKARGLPCR